MVHKIILHLGKHDIKKICPAKIMRRLGATIQDDSKAGDFFLQVVIELQNTL